MLIVGETVIAIYNKPLQGNTVAPPLEIGKTYEIKSKTICKCGQEHINVGIPSEYNYITCYNCKKEIPGGDRIHFCHPSRFEPIPK